MSVTPTDTGRMIANAMKAQAALKVPQAWRGKHWLVCFYEGPADGSVSSLLLPLAPDRPGPPDFVHIVHLDRLTSCLHCASNRFGPVWVYHWSRSLGCYALVAAFNPEAFVHDDSDPRTTPSVCP